MRCASPPSRSSSFFPRSYCRRGRNAGLGNEACNHLLTATDSATVNGVTVQTSASLTGVFNPTPPTVSILPTTSANGSGVGILGSQIDATTDNEAATTTFTFNFSEPVYNLTITVRDIDGGPGLHL